MSNDKEIHIPPAVWEEPLTLSKVVTQALWALGGTSSLLPLCDLAKQHRWSREHKPSVGMIGRVLKGSDFIPIGDDLWTLASMHTPEEVERMKTRGVRYPRKPTSES